MTKNKNKDKSFISKYYVNGIPIYPPNKYFVITPTYLNDKKDKWYKKLYNKIKKWLKRDI